MSKQDKVRDKSWLVTVFKNELPQQSDPPVGKADRCQLPTGGQYSIDADEWVAELTQQSGPARFALQAETCPKSGRVHFHFAIQWLSNKSAQQVVELFRKDGWAHPNVGSCRHTRSPFVAAWLYATKKESRIGGTQRIVGQHPRGARTTKTGPKQRYVPYSRDKERWWQRWVLAQLESEPDGRTVNWLWESDGNVGKSCLIQYILSQRDDVLVVSGSRGDILSGVADWVDPVNQKGSTGCGRPLHAIFVDIPRCSPEAISYGALESLLNMFFYNRKYRSRMVCLLQKLHIFIFSNSRPNVNMLSKDRWNIMWIGGNEGDAAPADIFVDASLIKGLMRDK